MKHQGPPLMVSSKGFYKWAWRIVEGCTNNCDYCYAEMESNDFSQFEFVVVGCLMGSDDHSLYQDECLT
jgi:DNA repair photolyase